MSVNKKEITLERRKILKNSKKNKDNLKIFQAYPNKIATMEIIVQKMVEI
jgi:16S rRNA U1498 N3-methylase RsmE